MRAIKTFLRSETPIILLYYLALPLLTYALSALWPGEIVISGAAIPVVLLFYLAAMAGLTLLGVETHKRIQRARQRRRLRQALAALSTSLEALLAGSPYVIEYASGQGEVAVYQVVDTRLRAQGTNPRDAVVARLGDVLSAQTWIAERHLAERETTKGSKP